MSLADSSCMVVKSRYNARSCPRTCFTKSLQPTGKEKGVTRRGYCCKWCEGFWKSKMGSSRFLQITSDNVVLQMVLDEPPKRLYNRWVKDRIEFYKRLEPTAPLRDVPLKDLQWVGPCERCHLEHCAGKP